jgi:uncharacterized Zn finger protein
MLMVMRTKCPDCGKDIEHKTLIFPDEGHEGDLVVECLNTGCRKLYAVRWKLSVKTKSYKVMGAADLQFQIELKDEEEQGGDDEP